MRTSTFIAQTKSPASLQRAGLFSSRPARRRGDYSGYLRGAGWRCVSSRRVGRCRRGGGRCRSGCRSSGLLGRRALGGWLLGGGFLCRCSVGRLGSWLGGSGLGRLGRLGSLDRSGRLGSVSRRLGSRLLRCLRSAHGLRCWLGGVGRLGSSRLDRLGRRLLGDSFLCGLAWQQQVEPQRRASSTPTSCRRRRRPFASFIAAFMAFSARLRRCDASLRAASARAMAFLAASPRRVAVASSFIRTFEPADFAGAAFLATDFCRGDLCSRHFLNRWFGGCFTGLQFFDHVFL